MSSVDRPSRSIADFLPARRDFGGPSCQPSPANDDTSTVGSDATRVNLASASRPGSWRPPRRLGAPALLVVGAFVGFGSALTGPGGGVSTRDQRLMHSTSEKKRLYEKWLSEGISLL